MIAALYVEKGVIMDETVYRVIDKSDNKVMTFSTAKHVASYMLGRRLGAYIVLKSSDSGDRVVVFSNYDYNAIALAMENA